MYQLIIDGLEKIIRCAKELGKLIGKSGNILVYGAEKEYSSLSTNAAINPPSNLLILFIKLIIWLLELRILVEKLYYCFSII